MSFAWINVDGFGHKDIYGCGGSVNYTGYCQRLVSADLDEADRILDAAQRGRVLDRADRQLAKDVPVIPTLSDPVGLRTQGHHPQRRPVPRQPLLERGGLVARPLALAATAAVSLLALSGAGGAATQQTPKRGGTVVSGTSTSLEPACLRVFADGCGQGASGFPLDMSHVLAGAFEVTPGAAFRERPRLWRTHRRYGAVHARLPHPPGSPVERRRSGQARRTSSSPTRRSGDMGRVAMRASEFAVSTRSTRRRSASSCGRAIVDWAYLFPIVLPSHALAGEDLATVWRGCGSTTRKRGQPIGSGPFLVGAWERGRQLTFVRNRRYWGPHPAYLDRLVYRFLPPDDVADALRRGEVDLIHPAIAALEAQHRELRRQPEPGIRVVANPVNAFEHFWIRVGDGGHPALRKRLVRQALAYGIDRVAITRAIGELNFERPPKIVPQDSLVLPKSSRYYAAELVGLSTIGAARLHQLLDQAGCRRGTDGIYSL